MLVIQDYGLSYWFYFGKPTNRKPEQVALLLELSCSTRDRLF